MRREAIGWRSSSPTSSDDPGNEMKSRTITVTVLAAIGVIAVWWLFVFSPARSDAKKANDDLSSAKETNRTLDTQNKQLDDLKSHEKEIKTELKRLQNAVPDDRALASFIDQANNIAVNTRVTWVSVAPTPPTSGANGGTPSSSNSLPVTISVKGPYYNVLDYINRLENIPRL